MRLVQHTIAKQKFEVPFVRWNVRRCLLFDVTSTKSLDEGGIEIVKVHELTWKALKVTFLSG